MNYLHELIDEYVRETESKWGRAISDDFFELVGSFWYVKPKAADIRVLMETLRKAA